MMSLLQNPIPGWVIQITAALAVLAPLVLSLANLDRSGRGLLLGFIGRGSERRWRFEFYSANGPVDDLLVAESDMPFPVRRVAPDSSPSGPATLDFWSQPQLELDVTAIDPWADEILQGIFLSPRVRFVSGDEAMVHVASAGRQDAAAVRIRAVAHRR